MSKELDIPNAIGGIFKRLRALEKKGLIPTQEELATTIPGGHSEKFVWVDWEPDYKALYESERKYSVLQSERIELVSRIAENVKQEFYLAAEEIRKLEFLISILAAVKPLDGSVGKEVW